jgi:hypothetical protein
MITAAAASAPVTAGPAAGTRPPRHLGGLRDRAGHISTNTAPASVYLLVSLLVGLGGWLVVSAFRRPGGFPAPPPGARPLVPPARHLAPRSTVLRAVLIFAGLLVAGIGVGILAMSRELAHLRAW